MTRWVCALMPPSTGPARVIGHRRHLTGHENEIAGFDGVGKRPHALGSAVSYNVLEFKHRFLVLEFVGRGISRARGDRFLSLSPPRGVPRSGQGRNQGRRLVWFGVLACLVRDIIAVINIAWTGRYVFGFYHVKTPKI